MNSPNVTCNHYAEHISGVSTLLRSSFFHNQQTNPPKNLLVWNYDNICFWCILSNAYVVA